MRGRYLIKAVTAAGLDVAMGERRFTRKADAIANARGRDHAAVVIDRHAKPGGTVVYLTSPALRAEERP